MVYVDSEELKWLPYVKSWLDKFNETLLNQEMKEFMLTLFEYAVENGFVFLKKNCEYSIHQVRLMSIERTKGYKINFKVEVSKAKMICSLIESFLTMPGAMDKIGEKSKVRCFLCQTFILSYLWGIGGNLLAESGEKFEIYVRDQFDDYPDAR